jgi:1-acyl-sn-glycerol-3-phosphate acyltransferase
MSTGYSVTPNDLGAWTLRPLSGAGRNSGPTQLRRFAALLRELLRMWIVALTWARYVRGRRRDALVQRLAARALAALGVRVVVRGHRPPARWPVLIVANHVSWLDTYAINTVNSACFVAKSEVATWPIVRTIARRFGTFFIVRGNNRSAARTKDALAAALRAGRAVAAFPEATTTDGRSLGRFYPAMLQAAVDAEVAVQPVAIRYRTADGGHADAAAFVGDMTVAESVRSIVREPLLVAEITFCPPFLAAGQSRRELAARARATIGAVLGFANDGREERRPSPQRRRDRRDGRQREESHVRLGVLCVSAVKNSGAPRHV